MRSDGTSYTNVVISVVGKWTPSKANTLRIVPEGLAFCNVGHVARIAILLASNERRNACVWLLDTILCVCAHTRVYVCEVRISTVY